MRVFASKAFCVYNLFAEHCNIFPEVLTAVKPLQTYSAEERANAVEGSLAPRSERSLSGRCRVSTGTFHHGVPRPFSPRHVQLGARQTASGRVSPPLVSSPDRASPQSDRSTLIWRRRLAGVGTRTRARGSGRVMDKSSVREARARGPWLPEGRELGRLSERRGLGRTDLSFAGAGFFRGICAQDPRKNPEDGRGKQNIGSTWCSP